MLTTAGLHPLLLHGFHRPKISPPHQLPDYASAARVSGAEAGKLNLFACLRGTWIQTLFARALQRSVYRFGLALAMITLKRRLGLQLLLSAC